MIRRTLGCICGHGTTECKDLIGIITPIRNYVIFGCVRFVEIVGEALEVLVLAVLNGNQQLIFLREEVSV